MDDYTISRVNYFEGQYLRTQDFTDEQNYLLAMRRRHNISHHTWGIVRGLELCWDSVSSNQFIIRPGIAIDGYGRELIVAQGQLIPVKVFDNKDSDILDVYVVYGRVESDPPGKGYAGCLPDGSTDSSAFYRTQERTIVRIEVGRLDTINRRSQPKDVPETDWEFSATRTPPDDPVQDWPVFLGQIRHNPADPKQFYSVDISDRPYAGLVGAVIHSPLQTAEVQIGMPDDHDDPRFAVFLKDEDVQSPPKDPQFEIKNDGSFFIQGNTTINGEVQVNGGGVEFKTIDEREDTEAAQPWQMYHVKGDAQNNRPEQLRIELPENSDNHAQLVIGSWSSKESKFVPCITISTDDCMVTIHGTLKADKIINTSNQTIDPTKRVQALSADAKQMVLGSYMSGGVGGTALLERFYQRIEKTGQLEERFSTGDGETLQERLSAAETNIGDPNSFVKNLIATHPETARLIQAALDKQLKPAVARKPRGKGKPK